MHHKQEKIPNMSLNTFMPTEWFHPTSIQKFYWQIFRVLNSRNSCTFFFGTILTANEEIALKNLWLLSDSKKKIVVSAHIMNIFESVSVQIACYFHHWNKEWSHFDLKSWVTGGTKIRPRDSE